MIQGSRSLGAITSDPVLPGAGLGASVISITRKAGIAGSRSVRDSPWSVAGSQPSTASALQAIRLACLPSLSRLH